ISHNDLLSVVMRPPDDITLTERSALSNSSLKLYGTTGLAGGFLNTTKKLRINYGAFLFYINYLKT
ncbi:MAG: hypothetical protein IJZ30_01220, partial [Alphaproteobacteria bacterium]|nr:hypothetical protein [Alphaproteobacteria bacterium]